MEYVVCNVRLGYVTLFSQSTDLVLYIYIYIYRFIKFIVHAPSVFDVPLPMPMSMTSVTTPTALHLQLKADFVSSTLVSAESSCVIISLLSPAKQYNIIYIYIYIRRPYIISGIPSAHGLA